jgi:hypothetical protein
MLTERDANRAVPARTAPQFVKSLDIPEESRRLAEI